MKFKDFQAPVLFSSTFEVLNLKIKNSSTFKDFQGCVETLVITYNRLSRRTGMVQVRQGPYVTSGSHSFTCHPHTDHSCLYFQLQGITVQAIKAGKRFYN